MRGAVDGGCGWWLGGIKSAEDKVKASGGGYNMSSQLNTYWLGDMKSDKTSL